MTLTVYIALIVFVLVAIVGVNIYVPRRLSTLFEIGKTWVLILAFFILTFLSGWGMGSVGKVENVLVLNLLKVGVIWLGFLPYLFIFLICFEILQRFIRINRKYAGLSIICLSVLLVIYGIWNARDYNIHHVDIPIPDLVQEVRIFHIPDIHLGPFRGKASLQSILTDIENLKPDFILINGDLVDGQEGLDPKTLELLKQVKYPMYFTTGNHDTYVDLPKMINLLTQYGVRVLNNEVVKTHGIQLVGLDYMKADDEVFDAHASKRKETIKSVLPRLKIDPGVPVVMVHHSPAGIKYMNAAGADLVLSGHTHAGQIFPATLIAQIQFSYLKGLHKYKNTTVYVSQGLGTFGPPMRIGTQGEATLVRLVRS